MLRVADILVLALAWLAVVAAAMRWALRGRVPAPALPLRERARPRFVVAGVAALVLAVVAGLLVVRAFRPREGATNVAQLPGSAATATSAAEPALNYPALDALPMLGFAPGGELGIAGAPSSGSRFDPRASIVLTGWISDPATHARSGDAFLVIDGRFRYPGIAAGGAPRGGFALELPLDRVAPGEHAVQAALRASKRSGFYLLRRAVRFTVGK
ncbi:MAG: hypothetical protein JO036_20390 [Candidatus Eremiobacteraeota bacterium]|nr:hypothetical protein [Candidatus Eremiobacteraeota bacterium]